MKNIMIIGAAVGDVLVYPASPEVFTAGSYPAREILLSTGGDGLNEEKIPTSAPCWEEIRWENWSQPTARTEGSGKISSNMKKISPQG